MKYIALFTIISLLLLQSCTNVNEVVYDKYAATDFYKSPAGSDVALASVYAQIGGNWGGVGYAGADRGWYDLNCMSTDEQVVPHRNTGDWEPDFYQMYEHIWLPNHAFVSYTWNWLYTSVYKANLAIELLENAKADPSKIAEAKVLRAFFYYLLMDDFGNVPFYTASTLSVNKIPQKSRKEVYDFVLSELTANVETLSPTRGGAYYGRFNKWAGYALLAKIYLNSEVYTGTAKWQECLDVCKKIDAGGFALHPGAANATSPNGYQYYELFGDVCPNDETIFAIYVKANTVSRNIFTVRSLNGPTANALFKYSGWNGTVTHKDYVNKFDSKDIRLKQFIWGQQAGGVTYSQDISSLDNPGANATDGIRNIKFYPVPPMDGGGASNDFPIYRYADILLMKAECLTRLNKAADAKPFVDAVRTRAGLTGLSAAPSLTDIYNERGFELTWEGHRRQDMIRFGTYLLPHDFKLASDPFRLLFPIPTSAINANPSLKQNTGY